MRSLFETFFDRLARARRGESDAFVYLCKPFWNKFLRKARLELFQRRSKLGRRADEEDILQNTLLAAWKDFKDFKGDSRGQWAVWLRTIFDHQVLLFIRTHIQTASRGIKVEARTPAGGSQAPNWDQLLHDHHSSPSQVVQRREEANWLQQKIEQLPSGEQVAIRQCLLAGRTSEEVASTLDQTAPAIRGRLRRAKQRLLALLGGARTSAENSGSK